MSVQSNITFRVGQSEGRTGFGTKDGRPIIYIGWLFTGDSHPTEVRTHGGDVTAFPKRDGRPGDVQTLFRAWEINAHDDHVYVYKSQFGRTGWFSSVFIFVDVDKAIAEIFAASSADIDATAVDR